jgi:hypothetical protein
MLSQLVLQGKVWALDIQDEALEKAKKLLEKCNRVVLLKQSHERFPEEIPKNSIRLIVYNLGYLPGGDKSITTKVDTTLRSIEAGQHLVMKGGVISITCYPGHPEGEKEEAAIMAYVSTMSPQDWSCYYHKCLNRLQAPSLILLQKSSGQSRTVESFFAI